MKKAGTHLGHCQACGRQQVVEASGLMAKHGYVVAGFGFFNGTCYGSGHLPLEKDRIFSDRIIDQLNDQAAKAEIREAALKAGTKTLLAVGKYDQVGNAVYMPRKSIYESRIQAQVDWAEASQAERQRGLAKALNEIHQNILNCRTHVEFLKEAIKAIHGKNLIPRKVIKKEPIKAGDTVWLWGSETKVLEIVTRRCQGVGPYLNGQHLPHIRFAGKNGQDCFYPARLVRRPK